MLEHLFTNPFLYSLALTLLHFLWQGLLVAFALKSILLVIEKSRSQLRYAVSAFAMLTNLLLAAVTFVIVFPSETAQLNNSTSPLPLTNLVNELTQQNAFANYQELLHSILAYSLPYISLFWLTTVCVLACKMLIELYNVNKLPKDANVQPSDELLERFNELAKQIHLKKIPTLLISMKVEIPMAIGWLKPVVLLPAGMITGLNPAQLEMLILHELAHIRRHDYLVNFLQTLIEILFFFHPAVRWISKQVRNEREYCSDDIAVYHCGDPIAYAHTLADTASLCTNRHHKHTIPSMAMAASGGDLKQRVLRLVDHHCTATNDVSKWFAGISIVFAILLITSNQLMTLPFAKQWNYKLPWQQSKNQLSDSYLMPAPSSIETTTTKLPASSRNLEDNIAHDTIASQLLSSQAKELNDIAIISEQSSEDLTTLSNSHLAVQNSTVEKTTQLTSDNSFSAKTDNEVAKSEIFAKQKPDVSNHKHQLNLKKPVSNNNDALTNQNPNTIISKSNQSKLAKTLLTKTPENIIDTSTKTKLELTTVRNNAFTTSAQRDFKQHRTEQPSQDQRSKVELAFEKTNSKQRHSQLTNPYSKELAELTTLDNKYLASIVKNNYTENKKSEASYEKQNLPVHSEAKQLKSIDPVYPSLAKRKGIEIEVKVNFTIDANGQVKNIQFAQQSKVNYFKNSIRAAVRKWRFLPAQVDNKAVESQMSKIFSFSLQS